MPPLKKRILSLIFDAIGGGRGVLHPVNRLILAPNPVYRLILALNPVSCLILALKSCFASNFSPKSRFPA